MLPGDENAVVTLVALSNGSRDRDPKVFPKAMKGFKSRGEESWKLAQGYSTKVPLVRFPIACDVRGNRGSPFPKLLLAPLQRHPKNLLLAY